MIHMMEQGTEEWKDIKRGKVSATGIVKLQAKGKGKTRADYKDKLVIERFTGLTEETYTNAAMERGIELEDTARALYEAKNLVVVEQVGFIDHPYIPMYGVSPDGLVGEEGLIEIKVVMPHIQLGYIENGIPTNYYKQMLSQLSVTGRKWNDFVSYSPGMKHLELLVIRLERDEDVIKEQDIDVIAFEKEVTARVAELEGMTI